MKLDSDMLFSCVVTFHPIRDAKLPATQGHHAHAAFLDIVRQVDPELAKTLHGSRGRKPFTVSPLRGLPPAREGRIAVKAGHPCWLRFTLLDGQLFGVFMDRFLQSDGRPTIRLAGADFTVGEILTTPDSHPWAGYITTQELLERWRGVNTGGKDNPAHTFEMVFASPTAFSFGGRGGKRIEVLPAPRLVFGSLASAWNYWFSSVFKMSHDLRDYVEQTVVVSSFQMETKMHQYRGYKQLGALGTITYLCWDYANPQMVRLLNTLADFAFYAGVGYKTTMGMGQVRRVMEG